MAFSLKFSTAFTVFLTNVKMQNNKPASAHKKTISQTNLFGLLLANPMIPKINEITVSIKQIIPKPINNAAVKNMIIKECYRVSF